MGTGQMLMGCGEDHTAPANGQFLAGLDPPDWSRVAGLAIKPTRYPGCARRSHTCSRRFRKPRSHEMAIMTSFTMGAATVRLSAANNAVATIDGNDSGCEKGESRAPARRKIAPKTRRFAIRGNANRENRLTLIIPQWNHRHARRAVVRGANRSLSTSQGTVPKEAADAARRRVGQSSPVSADAA